MCGLCDAYEQPEKERVPAPKSAKAYQATVIVEPRGRGGAHMIIKGRTFVLCGGIVRGLRELED